ALIPILSEPEQQRIVAKVDELMQLCDQLEERQSGSQAMHHQLVSCLLTTLTEATDAQAFSAAWSRIAANFDCLFTTEHSIEQLNQTILQLAVMGKLVPQHPNDEPASELLNKIATEKARLITEGKIRKQNPLPKISEQEKPFALPNGWEWVRLQNILDVRDGTHDSPKSATGENTYPLVTSKDFDNGIINFDSARRISAQDHFEIAKRSYVEQFDILFSMIGGNIGNQVMVKVDKPFGIKNVALFKYYNIEFTLPFYIKKITEHLALDLQAKAAGGAQPFVGLGYLRNIVIALPPINEQHRIVAKVDELMTLCEQLKTKLILSSTLQQQLAETLVQQAVA
ncbi:MAG: restriction endonuclease subunit S, partial [Methylococcaceae bacterium]